MSPSSNRYDAELQMFTYPPREPNRAHPRFLRWLGERGLLEHGTAGIPTGEYTLDAPMALAATW